MLPLAVTKTSLVKPTTAHEDIKNAPADAGTSTGAAQ